LAGLHQRRYAERGRGIGGIVVVVDAHEELARTRWQGNGSGFLGRIDCRPQADLRVSNDAFRVHKLLGCDRVGRDVPVALGVALLRAALRMALFTYSTKEALETAGIDQAA